MDQDDGINAEMVYRIIDGDPSGFFAVGATDGHIALAAPLDREQVRANGDYWTSNLSVP